MTNLNKALANFKEEIKEEIKEQQAQNTRFLSTEMHNLVPKVLHGSITPSEASGAQSQTFFSLISMLGLPSSPEFASKVFKQQKDSRRNFTYDWEKYANSSRLESIPEEFLPKTQAHTAEDACEEGSRSSNRGVDPAELASYVPLCQYLREMGLDAVVVGNGQGLPGGLLYNVHAYTMRREKKVRGQEVHYVTRIHGRTDIVVLDKFGKRGDVTRERVAFAIEVKPARVLKDKHVETVETIEGAHISDEGVRRSVITQLLGLNICNPYNAPPVLLTNLVGTHIVYHITEHEDYPWFRIACQKCSTFLSALQFIEGLLEKRVRTFDFGRPPSPDTVT